MSTNRYLLGAAAIQAVVHAISEPRRREILRLVRGRELAAGEIASHFEVTRPAISQHLTVLKNAGLVRERREGTRRLYSARPEGLAELRGFLERLWGRSARCDEDRGGAGGKKWTPRQSRKAKLTS